MNGSRRGALIQALLVVVASAVVTGCDVIVQSMDQGGLGGGGIKATDTWTRTYAVGGAGVEVIVVNLNGKVQVEAADGDKVEVKAELTARAGTEAAAKDLLKQVQIVDEATATRVRIQTRHQKTFGRQGVTVTYTLRVPRAVKVNLETVNGGISVAGIEGGTRAESTNGSVECRLLAGGVKASSTNGSIKVDLKAVGAEGVELETTNGGIDVRLPETAKASVVARCVNGGISVDGLTIERSGESTRRRLDGQMNGGGPTLRAETVNGGIHFRKSS
jgi:hypothetical protein